MRDRNGGHGGEDAPDGHCNLEDAYAMIDGQEIWLIGSEIPGYAMGNLMNHKPKGPPWSNRCCIGLTLWNIIRGQGVATRLYLGSLADLFQRRSSESGNRRCA